MAEMVGSAFVQEAVSRAVSFVLGKREEAASQGHLMERLEMAANHLEFALEKSNKLPILDVSLLQRRKMIKYAYVQAMELLERHNRQQQAVLPAVSGQEDRQLVSARGQKSKLWMIFRANKQNVVPVAPSSSGGGLDTAAVQRFGMFADWGRGLVQDVESACSLLRNNLCSNPFFRHLFEGRNLRCQLVQGNQRRNVEICPLRSEERGVEVLLMYRYCEGDSTPMGGKAFTLMLFLRLSESVDIVGVALKGLEYLASQSKLLPAESAVGELTLLPTLLQGLPPSRVPWEVDSFARFMGTNTARFFRRDPACCGASRLGLCSSNNVSSEFSHIFPEEVICFLFHCYISAAVEPPNSSRSRGSSAFGAGRSISSSMVGWTPPLTAFVVCFAPHAKTRVLQSQTLKTLKSDAINCFLRQPELPDYWIRLSSSRHGGTWCRVGRPSIQPRSRRRYNTRGTSTKPRARR